MTNKFHLVKLCNRMKKAMNIRIDNELHWTAMNVTCTTHVRQRVFIKIADFEQKNPVFVSALVESGVVEPAIWIFPGAQYYYSPGFDG